MSPFSRFALGSGAAAAASVAVGWLPTVRLAGEGATEALVAGCAISWIASLIGAAPLARLKAESPPPLAIVAVLSSLGLRFAAVVLLGAVAVLRGPWQPRPLLIWIALSYLPLLGVDIGFALAAVRGASAPETRSETR